jgi:hypothetical protein
MSSLLLHLVDTIIASVLDMLGAIQSLHTKPFLRRDSKKGGLSISSGYSPLQDNNNKDTRVKLVKNLVSRFCKSANKVYLSIYLSIDRSIDRCLDVCIYYLYIV